MPMRRGADVKVDIDGVPFAAQRVRAGDRSPALNVSNSEGQTGNPVTADGPNYVSKTPDLREGTLQLVNATFDDDNNPFGSPLFLTSGNWYAVLIYPAGRDGEAHDYGNLLLESVGHDFGIPGLQPCTFDFVSDGSYTLAGEE